MIDNPIYIVGLDRSGKTLLRLALSAHPHLALTRKTYMWPRFYQRYGDLAKKQNLDRCIKAMFEQKSIRQFNLSQERIRHEFSQGEASYAHLFALFHRQFAENIGKKRWGEQAGLVEQYAPAILQAFPAAKIIHMIRDPRNRCEEILNSTPPHIRTGKIGSMTAGWLFSARLALRHRENYPHQYKVITYESLLISPEDTLMDICAFIGEKFVPEMLTLENSVVHGRDEKGKPDPHLIWTQDTIHFQNNPKALLQPIEVRFIQSFAKKEMELLGYKIAPLEMSLKKNAALIFEWPIGLIRMATWRLLEASTFN